MMSFRAANSMRQKPENDGSGKSASTGIPPAHAALPGRGGLSRIVAAFWNSLGGLREGLATESAIKQEVAIACLLLPLSFFVAKDVWTWAALAGSILFVLAIEFLNTAIERLCNHIQPEKHEAIRITKDLASAGVFFALVLAGLVWVVALWDRFAS
jgi:diacylglycerol kinase (ATP)